MPLVGYHRLARGNVSFGQDESRVDPVDQGREVPTKPTSLADFCPCSDPSGCAGWIQCAQLLQSSGGFEFRDAVQYASDYCGCGVSYPAPPAIFPVPPVKPTAPSVDIARATDAAPDETNWWGRQEPITKVALIGGALMLVVLVLR